MKKVLAYLLFSFLLSSCVSESEYDRINSEKNVLVEENQNLKAELDEIKFGIPNLISDGKKFFDGKQFAQAKEKFQILIEKHPDAPEAMEAKKYLDVIEEEELWQTALNSDEIVYTQNYISKYPNGTYINSAITRLSDLKILNQRKDYEAAANSNSSYAWKKFLEDYPDYPNKSYINEKIIRLEVDEILGSSETGQMPSFNSYGSSYTSSSTVDVTNNTGCTLTVRYSGVDAKLIEIPSGGTRSVYLSSGNYKIAASACGSNYAGTENLHGSYSSEFYISRTRY